MSFRPLSTWPDNLRALRHRDFRLYWGGQAVSLVGSWMQTVAQGWLMHRLTASPFMLGLLGFAQFLPVLPLALPAGVLVDRVDRRRLLMITQSLMLLQAVLLASTVTFGVVQPWMVLALALMHGCVNTFDLPTRQSFVIDMVGRDDLPNGIALNSAAFNSARIVGPMIAGLLLATVGEVACFWLNAVSFLAVLAGLAAMKRGAGGGAGDLAAGAKGHAPRVSQPMATTLREGLQYVWSSRSIRTLLVLLAICAGLGFQYSLLLPVYTRDLLHAGPRVYGALLAAFGLGSLLAALRMTMPLDRWALRRQLMVGLTLGGLGMAGFAWIRVFPGMLAMGFLAGFGLILYVSSTNTLIQLTTLDRFRGRVMSLYTLFFVGTAPFGALLTGGIAQRFGAPVATSVSALALLSGALWVAARLRGVAAEEAGSALERGSGGAGGAAGSAGAQQPPHALP